MEILPSFYDTCWLWGKTFTEQDSQLNFLCYFFAILDLIRNALVVPSSRIGGGGGGATSDCRWQGYPGFEFSTFMKKKLDPAASDLHY